VLMHPRSPAIRRAATVFVTGLTAAATVMLSTGPAMADTIIKAKYKVTGTTFIKKANFTLTLTPGTLNSNVNADTGKLTGTLTLPNATAKFKQLGLVPVTAVTQFINDGQTTGTLNLDTGAVKTTSKVTLRIVKLTVGGLPQLVGKHCQTSKPAVITVNSQKDFNVLQGGHLSGTYTIPPFANCLLDTLLINLTLPGPGNTISLKLGPAQITPPPAQHR
jgi:hypothetical protein